MKVLVIDSHKSSKPTPANNLHWINARQIADMLGGDLIWSYPTVNDDIKGGYDVIIFVHASMYGYVDYKWLEASPNAKLFYVTNEYNLGESRILWMAAKAGRKYEVIANHAQKISKVVNKYVEKWHRVNLNALCVNPKEIEPTDIQQKVLYYGSFRKGRISYFQKYFNNNNMIVSSHKKNHQKFFDVDVNPEFIPRVNWSKDGLANYKLSLYIEDEKTHNSYNYLANRFYEAINQGVVPLFDESCRGTLERSVYDIGDEYIIDSTEELDDMVKSPPEFQDYWVGIAKLEKFICLSQIARLIGESSNLDSKILEIVDMPKEIEHPKYGVIWKDGEFTEEGSQWFIKEIVREKSDD